MVTKILVLIFIVFVGLFFAAMVFDFVNLAKLRDAVKSGTEESVESICKSTRYAGRSIENLPVVCLKYYQK